MSDELQQPSVVDLEALLQPISEEAPSGENLRYSGIYDQINEARRADDNLNQGAWQTELKVADFREVIDLALPPLTTRTKDLQIAAWLSEALVKVHGFAGFRDSMILVASLQDKFWETLHPEIDEGDQEGRANAISWIDNQVSLAVKYAPLLGERGYGFSEFEESKRFEIPENIDSLSSEEKAAASALKAQVEKERRVTGDMWRRQVAETRRAWCETVNFTLEECSAALNELDRVVEEKYDRNQMPGIANCRKTIDAIRSEFKKILEQKRIEEPDAVPDEAGEESGEGEVGADGRSAGVKGPVKSRQDALRQLIDIAEYFQRTEPHSPVSFLVQRAVKWGHMGLDTWLQDVIKDTSIIEQVRQTLGFNTSDGQAPPE